MKNIIKLITLAIFIITFIPNFYPYSKVEKIGIVDLVEVFDKFVEGKEIAKEYNEYKKLSEERLNNIRRELNDLRTRIVELSNTIVSMGTNVDYQTTTRYESLLKEYNSKVDIFMEETKKIEDTLSKYRDSLKQYVYRDILNYIRSYGDRNGYSIILDTRGNIIYYSRGNDITSDLNKWIKVQEDAKKKY